MFGLNCLLLQFLTLHSNVLVFLSSYLSLFLQFWILNFSFTQYSLYFVSFLELLLFYREAYADEEEIIEKKTPTEKQILASSELLEKLLIEGDEVVSKIFNLN